MWGPFIFGLQGWLDHIILKLFRQTIHLFFYIHNMNVTNAIESNVLCPAVFRSVFGFSAWKIREGESDMGLNFVHESLVLVTST